MSETLSGQSTGKKTVGMTANGAISPGLRLGDMTMSMQVPSSTGTQSLQMQFVLDGNTIFVKLPASLALKVPGSKPWISMDLAQMGKLSGIPGYGSLITGSSNFSNPGQYLDFLRATADGSVKDLGQETVNGVQTTHYRAQVDLAKLPDAVPSADKSAAEQLVSMIQSKGANTRMPVDAWIDGSHQIRRLQLSYDLSVSGESVALGITENLSDYGPQPPPALPGADQTTNVMSLIKGG